MSENNGNIYECVLLNTSADVKGIRGFAPFKDCIDPYGAFANTTSTNPNSPFYYPITQTHTLSNQPLVIPGCPSPVVWPSAEHAFHAQKVIHYRDKLAISNAGDSKIGTLNAMLLDIYQAGIPPRKSIFLPKSGIPHDPDTYEGIVNRYLGQLNLTTKTEFDDLCQAGYHPLREKNGTLPVGQIDNSTGLPYTYAYMKRVIELKLAQHPQLKQTAKGLAANGILPVEISQHDMTWASFKEGTGKNYLGIILLECGNHLLKQEEHLASVPIENPHDAYLALQHSGESFGYDHLRQFVNNNGSGSSYNPLPNKVTNQTPLSQSNIQNFSYGAKLPPSEENLNFVKISKEGAVKNSAIYALLHAIPQIESFSITPSATEAFCFDLGTPAAAFNFMQSFGGAHGREGVVIFNPNKQPDYGQLMNLFQYAMNLSANYQHTPIYLDTLKNDFFSQKNNLFSFERDMQWIQRENIVQSSALQVLIQKLEGDFFVKIKQFAIDDYGHWRINVSSSEEIKKILDYFGEPAFVKGNSIIFEANNDFGKHLMDNIFPPRLHNQQEIIRKIEQDYESIKIQNRLTNRNRG